MIIEDNRDAISDGTSGLVSQCTHADSIVNENCIHRDILIRNRAAALLVSNGLILVQRQEGDDFWALPGGKIEVGESSEQALMRELREELDWAPKRTRLVCVAENMFEHGGLQYQQYGFYYEIAATQLWRRQGSPSPGREFRAQEHQLIFAWQRRANIAAFDVRPTFLQSLYAAKSPRVVHRVNGFEPNMRFKKGVQAR